MGDGDTAQTPAQQPKMLNLDDLQVVSMTASAEEYAAARKRSWLAKSERGIEVLTHREGWDLISNAEFDIGGGFGVILDQVGITEGPYREEWNKQIICNEGPTRVRLRTALAKLLRPGQVAKLQSDVRDIINETLDEIGDPSDVNWVQQFTRKIPTKLFCDLVSAPREMHDFIGGLSDAIGGPILMLERDKMAESERAYWEGLAFMKEHIQKRRSSLGDDFTSQLIEAELEGLLSPDEVETTAMALLMAAMDNTYNQMAMTFGVLLEDRSRWEHVVANPNLAQQAAEETFRLRPRFATIARHASQDMPYNDIIFPRGSWIWVSSRSAGRDESLFPEANTFQFGRPAARAIQFGASNYSCLGATLARLEISEAIKIVGQRYPGIRLLGDWTTRDGPLTSEVEHMRVALT